jgi:hypothetical protein
MTQFEEWFYDLEAHSTRSERFYEELAVPPNLAFRAKAWLEAAYNQGFQNGYNSPMPPTDFV